MNPDISVVIVSYNTRDLLRECLATLRKETEGIPNEVLVVDNASRDGSAEMVKDEFPEMHVIRTKVNLGFGGANNRALAVATGRYVVLLNSDAFLKPSALRKSIEHMDADPRVGLGGARLIGADGSWQASCRMFPSPLNDFLCLSGLAYKFPKSRFFGRQDNTWADPDVAAEADWVPGAYSIIRRSVLNKVGYFDERFFLYYEEVDLCRRIKQAGYSVRYWPDVVVVHLGGESSKTVTSLTMSISGAQLELWQMRSAFLYYRKHHGQAAWLKRQIEEQWHKVRTIKNRLMPGDHPKRKVLESRKVLELWRRAWQDTSGGAVSPGRPW